MARFYNPYDDDEKDLQKQEQQQNQEQQDNGLSFDDDVPPAPPVDVQPEQPAAGTIDTNAIVSGATEGVTNATNKKIVQAQADTAKQVYDIQEELAKGEKKRSDDFIRNSKRRFGNYQNAYEQETLAVDAKNKELKTAIDTANKALEDNNREILRGYIRDAELARQENEILSRGETRAALWTGATELGAAIANLIGVSTGASHQQYNSVSDDWMRRADQNRRLRTQRIDSLKARRDAIASEMAKLRSANAKEGAQLQYKVDTYKAGRDTEIAGKSLEHGDKMAAFAHGADSNYAKAMATAKAGLVQGVGTAKASGMAPRYYGGGRTSTTSTTTSARPAGIPSNAYPISLGGKSYWVDDRSVIRNVQAHRRQFDSATQAEVNAILNNASMKEQEKALALLQYLESSPEVLDAVINSSYGEYNQQATQQQGTPQNNDFNAWLNQ